MPFYLVSAGQCYFSKSSNSSNIYIFSLECIKNQKLCHFTWLVVVSAISKNSQIHQIFIYFAYNALIIRNYSILVGQWWLVLFQKMLKYIKYLYILMGTFHRMVKFIRNIVKLHNYKICQDPCNFSCYILNLWMQKTCDLTTFFHSNSFKIVIFFVK